MRIFVVSTVLIAVFFGVCGCKTYAPVEPPGYTTSTVCDVNLFDVTTVDESCKKGKILVTYKDSVPTSFEVKIKKQKWRVHWDVIKQDSLYYLVRIDTVHGAYKLDRLFDSIMVLKNRVVHLRTQYDVNGNLSRYYVEEIYVDSNRQGHYKFMWPEVQLSSLEFLKAHPSILGIQREATFSLGENKGILSYKNKSLFWHAMRSFLDFYFSS